MSNTRYWPLMPCAQCKLYPLVSPIGTATSFPCPKAQQFAAAPDGALQGVTLTVQAPDGALLRRSTVTLYYCHFLDRHFCTSQCDPIVRAKTRKEGLMHVCGSCLFITVSCFGVLQPIWIGAALWDHRSTG